MKHFPLKPRLPLVAQLRARLEQEPFFSDHPPSAGTICILLNLAFWASMQSEEGRPVRATLALINPDYSSTQDVFRLSHTIALSSHSIAKLSATFPFRSGAIAVTFPLRCHPLIWGIVLPKPEDEWLVEILGPGYIVIKNGPSIQATLLPDGSQILFDRLTRLEDDWCDLLFHHANHTAIGHEIPFEHRLGFYGFLQILARAMVEHRQGGSVVMVSPDDHAWETAVDFKYKFVAPAQYLTNLFSSLKKWRDRWSKAQERKRKSKREQRPEIEFYPDSEPERIFRETLRLVGGMTAVDGAIVMTTTLQILGYGAKLMPKTMETSIREWLPGQGYSAESMPLGDIGGTRHRSAAQFAHQHPGTIVFVASQDGRFTIFVANESANEVLALRAELLLM